MCSNTSSGNYGDDYSGLCPKKQKHNNNGRRRVPRRGPGVAELEKIRLEERHISAAAPLLPHPPPEKPPSVILPSTTERTVPVYPFSSYLSTGSFPNDLIPPAPVFQRNHDSSSLHYLPPVNNYKAYFSKKNESTKSQIYQFIEPPSNQTSCHDSVSQFHEDKKIVAAKRPWQFISETTKCNVGTTVTISRDGKQIKSLNQKLKNHFQDSRTTTRTPITIDSHTPPVIPNSSLHFPHFIHDEQKEGFNHDIMPQRSGANISSNTKPFYSFLPANEKSTRDQDLSFILKTESTDHGIDLRLKL